MNKCPECGNNDFRHIEGEEVCIACGLVVEDRPLQNPSYISQATINHADQPFLMEAGSKKVNGRIIRSNWIYSTREKNMQSGMSKIDLIASKHKLPEMVITESKLIFKKSLYSNWFPVHTCKSCGTKYCSDCGGKVCPKCGSSSYSDFDKVYLVLKLF